MLAVCRKAGLLRDLSRSTMMYELADEDRAELEHDLFAAVDVWRAAKKSRR